MEYAIAVVVHDKQDHSNALVTLDFLSKPEFEKYNHPDSTFLVTPDRLASEPGPAQSASYILSFEYACRKGVNLSSCLGEVFWNDQNVGRISPNDYRIQSYSVELKAKDGQNNL